MSFAPEARGSVGSVEYLDRPPGEVHDLTVRHARHRVGGGEQLRPGADRGADIVAELAARPPTESPSEALRHAVWVPFAACTDYVDHTERARVVARLILDTPALHARWLERQLQVRAALATRCGLDPDTDPYPRMVAGMALLAFDSVLLQWRPGDGERRLAELTDQAFAVVAPALDAPARARGSR